MYNDYRIVHVERLSLSDTEHCDRIHLKNGLSWFVDKIRDLGQIYGLLNIATVYTDHLLKFLIHVIDNVIMDYFIPTLNYHVQWLSISDIEQRNHVLYMHTDYHVKIFNNFKSSLSLSVIWGNSYSAVNADYHVL